MTPLPMAPDRVRSLLKEMGVTVKPPLTRQDYHRAERGKKPKKPNRYLRFLEDRETLTK